MHDFLTPVVETEPRPAAFDREKTRYLRSYLLMRAMVGAIGVVLPFLLVLGDRLLFSGKPFPRDSLSAYYYSGVRDLFVGTLSVTAIFLVTYKVIERNLDNTLSIVAGLAALERCDVSYGPADERCRALAVAGSAGRRIRSGNPFRGSGRLHRVAGVPLRVLRDT